MSLKGGVRLQKLGQSGGGKRVLGGDIERWAGKTMRLRELGGEKEREEDLSFASSTLSCKLSNIAGRDPASKGLVNGIIKRADSTPSLDDLSAGFPQCLSLCFPAIRVTQA
jgi:hypothetical protein